MVDGGNPLAVAVGCPRSLGRACRPVPAPDDPRSSTASPSCANSASRRSQFHHLVQSHLHIDHTGALGHFPDATVIVQAQELDAARSADPPHAHGYVREDFDQAGARLAARRRRTGLFGDGTIRLLSTPGHSAGHTSLLLRAGRDRARLAHRRRRGQSRPMGWTATAAGARPRARMPSSRWNVFGNSRMRPTRWSCSDTIRTTGRGSGMRRTTTRETAQGVDARAALVGPVLPRRPVRTSTDTRAAQRSRIALRCVSRREPTL